MNRQMTTPGYYNHCAVCGHTASGHHRQVDGRGSGYTQPEHEFEMRDDEKLMASPTPDWQSFWELQERVEKLERQVIQLDSRPQFDYRLLDPNCR